MTDRFNLVAFYPETVKSSQCALQVNIANLVGPDVTRMPNQWLNKKE